MVMETSRMLFDYLVFIAAIIASFIVPLWGKFRTKRKETKASYVFATGSVSMGAMMLSIARGTLGVRSFLGFPSELYYRGSAMWETIYGMLLAYPIVCFIFVPVYYSLGITSVYQYLDMRFHSKLVRCLASFSYVLRSLLNLAVIVFTPCVALNAVIGLPYWASIIGITTISVIFSSMGGLQAAILSDVIQGVTMITISLLITVEGVIDVGGPSTVLNVTQSRGRLEFLNFNMDPTIRVTTVSATVGQLFMSLSIFGCQQNFVQRYCSMSSHSNVVKIPTWENLAMSIIREMIVFSVSLKKIILPLRNKTFLNKKSALTASMNNQTMIYNMPVISAFFTLSWLVGMVIFATYADCDPLRMGYISKFDEIVPFYVEDKLAYIPGVLGLVMATLFNGALTLAVSNLNSLATVTFEDFLSQIPALSHLTDRRQLQLIKLIGVVYGFLIVAASFLVAMLSGVIESSMLMTSATSGPLLGVFILAMLVPCANWKGAASGMLFSHVLSLWLTFGHLTVTNEEDALPLSTDGCKNDTFSSHLMKPTSVLISSVPELKVPMTITSKYEPGMLEYIYSITYMYYALIGSLTTVLVGIFVSLLTADEKKDIYEQHLLHPLAVKISKWFPGKPRLFSESRKLSDDNENVNPASKTSVNVAEHISIGKTKQGSDQYMKKFHTLKEASLDVTNEVAKGTKL